MERVVRWHPQRDGSQTPYRLFVSDDLQNFMNQTAREQDAWEITFERTRCFDGAQGEGRQTDWQPLTVKGDTESRDTVVSWIRERFAGRDRGTADELSAEDQLRLALINDVLDDMQ